MKNRRLIYAASALGLAMLACASVSVTNTAQIDDAVIRVTLPEGSYGTTRLKPSESVDYEAMDSGPVTVEMIPDQEYIAALKKVQGKIIDEWASNGPGAKNYEDAALELTSLQTSIASLEASGGECHTIIPNDIPEGKDWYVNVELVLDKSEQNYQLNNFQWSCNIKEGMQ